jgi:TetR/AcrR family transcriptional repressor of nem operon
MRLLRLSATGVMVIKRNPDETRERILQAAFEEIHHNGFRSASVDAILANTGLTKGALYHHFPNKAALGYAVVDEIIRRKIEEFWIKPIDREPNPLEGLRGVFNGFSPEEMHMACTTGCPLNNLAQEMSPIDEEFRERIAAVYRAWQAGLVSRLEQGKVEGYVREDVDCDHASTFLVAAIGGASGLAKNSQDPNILLACASGIRQFIDALRPVAVTVPLR